MAEVQYLPIGFGFRREKARAGFGSIGGKMAVLASYFSVFLVWKVKWTLFFSNSE